MTSRPPTSQPSGRKPRASGTLAPATQAVHAGESPDASTGSLIPPIYQTSAFAFDSVARMADVLAGRAPGDVYTRYGNPTLRAVEEKMAALEGAEAGVVFASGMAAVVTAVLSVVAPGDHVVASRDVYGQTFEAFRDLLPRFGAPVTFVDVRDTHAMAAAITPKTKALYVETPTNPMLRLADLAAVAGLGRARGLVTIVDSTVASPVGQTPLALGIDLVLHSATKYLGGHDDIVAGVLAGRQALIARARKLRELFGAVLDPHAAWLLLRGLRTLALRVERQSANAQAIASYLAAHPGVAAVHYPGLPGHPQHDLARRQMRYFGGLLAFDVRGTGETAARVAESLSLATLAPSLGGVETLVLVPATSSHRQLTAEDRALAGVSDTTIRLSVGIEDEKDLIADLEQALAAAGASARAAAAAGAAS